MKLLREAVPKSILAKPRKFGGSKIFGLRYRGPSLARIVGTSAIERKVKAGLGISQTRRMIGLGKLVSAGIRGERATGRNANQARNWLYGKIGWYGRHPSLTVLRQAYHGYKKGGVKGAIANAIEKPVAIMKATVNPMNYVRQLGHAFKRSTGLSQLRSLFGTEQPSQRRRSKQQPLRKFASGTKVSDILAGKARYE